MGNRTAIHRGGCLLHGALQTIGAIEGAVPIVHSTAGCGVQQALGGASLSGGTGPDGGGAALPSTNFLERQVVFGGTSRLREQLKNAVRIRKGDVYAVLTGCTPELVGDDVPAMTKELREQGWKAVQIGTPGFKGSVHDGYAASVLGLLRQLGDGDGSPAAKREAGLVNLFGILPGQDVFWRGNLRGLAAALESIGAEANVLFGPGGNAQAWTRVNSASLNLSFSPHSLAVCEWLERTAGIPYLQVDGYPVGAAQTNGLLQAVGEWLNLPGERLAESAARREAAEHYYLRQMLEMYYRFGFQRSFAIVGDSASVPGIARFLDDPLGLTPERIILTDDPGPAARAGLRRRLSEGWSGPAPDIAFEQDAAAISALLEEAAPELLLASSIEAGAAERLGIPLVPVSFPLADRLVLDRGYAGYEGALSLLEDVGSAILRSATGSGAALTTLF